MIKKGCHNPNKGKSLVKTYFTREEVKKIREAVQEELKTVQGNRRLTLLRDRAVFNFGIDSMLRSCDLVKVTVDQVNQEYFTIHQKKIAKEKILRSVEVRIKPETQECIFEYLDAMGITEGIVFRGTHSRKPLESTYVNFIVKDLVMMIGLDPKAYGAYSLTKTVLSNLLSEDKASSQKIRNIYKSSQFLGIQRPEHLLQYLGIEDDLRKLINEANMANPI